MKRSQSGDQYTVRGVPARVDEALRRKARDQGKSLNQVTIEALSIAAGVAETEVRYHDLDSLVESWLDDPQFEAALEEHDQVDQGLWE